MDNVGQTFYFLREMTEELDSPTLRIDVSNRSISVFLDDTLIYADCPDADNRIGYLELPRLEFDKSESVVVSIPFDYVGHTLTITQSTPLIPKSKTVPTPFIPVMLHFTAVISTKVQIILLPYEITLFSNSTII